MNSQTFKNKYYFVLQLRKHTSSTLSITSGMKVSGSGGRGDSGVVGEEAGIALVSIHSDYPRYTEERTGLVCKVCA